MILRLTAAVLALAGAGAILWVWTGGIGVLGGTALWDYRYLVLVVGTLLGLSLLDSLMERIGTWLKGPKAD
ncbi:MAG: hypothetical protein KDA73_01030 [Rhodobacteraceae bacterium]|nr:hypothetical protein [Paracoccaceae bacterium]